MKIVLVEERAGQPYPEREFTSEVVKVGRDGNECDLVFDQSDPEGTGHWLSPASAVLDQSP